MTLPTWVQATRMNPLPMLSKTPAPQLAALIGVGAAPAGVGIGGGLTVVGGAATIQLAFVMQQQQHTNWCWAAVSVSVALYHLPNSTWQQCQVVSQELGMVCCVNPMPGGCDTAWYLDQALARVGHLNTWAAGFLAAAEIRQELTNNHPVGCRIGWDGGGGHFVIVSGIQSNTNDDVTVEDPFHGQSVVPLATFQTNYLNAGSWTHSYYTN